MRARRGVAGLLAVPLAVVTLGLGSCAVAAPDLAPTRTSSNPSASTSVAAGSAPTAVESTPATGAQTSLDRLFAAGVAGDRGTWDAGVAASDATFAARSSLLFDNLRTLRPSRLQVRLSGAEQPLPDARQAELGPGAHVVQAQLAWRLPAERADAVASVWLTLVPGPAGERLAGTDDGTGLDVPAVPLWWLAPVTVLTRRDVTVLVGPGQDAGRWLRLAAQAVTDTRAHLPRPLRDGWDSRLVVEVPGSQTDFTRVLGAAPSAYATTAAVTRPEGPTTQAAVRVVVNPATAGDSAAVLGTTLTHETVHVATRSATSAAPLWAVEGLAEDVALEAHPDQRADELAALRGGGRPTRLPADAAFGAGSAGVTAAYAQAWLACRAVVDHRGRTDLGRFYLALDSGRPLEAAARSTLGVDGSEVVRWWRHDLVRATASGRR